MIKVTLKDGSIIEVEKGTKVSEIAKSLSQGLYKKALSAKINGKRSELMAEINEDCELEILTFEDDDGKWTLRHTGSHILAQAVKRLYPEVKLAIGPAIENGFYYDFEADFSFTPEILEKIEKEMQKIIKEDLQVERFELPRSEAIEYVRNKNEDYKVELIQDLPEDSIISFYKQGEFVDLCAGPHVPSTKKVKAVKLLSLAGAYWRGDEKKKMLQRIYGTAFAKQSELEAYLNMLEEAKKRDHRKIGKELGLFAMHEEGPGFPFFYPKGMVLRNLLEDYWREVHRKAGYDEIKTPIILSESLWHQSGHWDHYKENMYFTKIDEEDFAIKPMNCPGSILVYKDGMHSYKELPIRLAELGLVHRHELSGALHGLMRVRCFTQDDAHIFMTKDQITDEVVDVIKLIDEFYKKFGFDYFVELSTRPENSMGSDEDWELATNGLKLALDKAGLKYKVNEGDGAFYGPKIDFHLRDCIGRTWQCGTVQLDFQMPERFDISYIGADSEKHRPVMVHRVVFGSIERFIGILIEHFAGAFPTWLSPVQVKVLPISEKFHDYAKQVEKQLKEKDIRVETDFRAEKIGYKIREGRMERVPYLLIVGEKEVENNEISVRSRKNGDEGVSSLDSFIEKIQKEVETKENYLVEV
ncbi:threonine--tRNA ligase [Clostridium algidicarnis]|uniref:Threonine--tRNA ligase n=1 Tax=Clostridium algidicarnis DSM 15099 TaxID=1121295 RepID=A0A2S6FXC9_9CLOT|nr:threonine--tRNA ligase [Clostridium algidicarnis]PPK48260.1 threonyl-tRNA synthetase [Clostridium algidicarnis DSM 15099]